LVEKNKHESGPYEGGKGLGKGASRTQIIQKKVREKNNLQGIYKHTKLGGENKIGRKMTGGGGGGGHERFINIQTKKGGPSYITLEQHERRK